MCVRLFVLLYFQYRGASISSATQERVIIDGCYFADNESVDAAGGVTGFNTIIRNCVFERNIAGACTMITVSSCNAMLPIARVLKTVTNKPHMVTIVV
jgi:hypothetical protein